MTSTENNKDDTEAQRSFLRSFVLRIECLLNEEKVLRKELRKKEGVIKKEIDQIYTESSDAGFDISVLRKFITSRTKKASSEEFTRKNQLYLSYVSLMIDDSKDEFEGQREYKSKYKGLNDSIPIGKIHD